MTAQAPIRSTGNQSEVIKPDERRKAEEESAREAGAVESVGVVESLQAVIPSYMSSVLVMAPCGTRHVTHPMRLYPCSLRYAANSLWLYLTAASSTKQTAHRQGT